MSESPIRGGSARDNPFRVSRVLQLRYRLDAEGWCEMLERLERSQYRGALVGPEGSGKTTLLEDLETRFAMDGWRVLRLRLNRQRRRLDAEEWTRIAKAGRQDLISVDGVEQLPWWQRRRLDKRSRPAGGLVVTSHRPGFLSTLREHQTSPELLVALVSELIGVERTANLEPMLGDLFAEHRGNVRDCLRSLYDLWPELS